MPHSDVRPAPILAPLQLVKWRWGGSRRLALIADANSLSWAPSGIASLGLAQEKAPLTPAAHDAAGTPGAAGLARASRPLGGARRGADAGLRGWRRQAWPAGAPGGPASGRRSAAKAWRHQPGHRPLAGISAALAGRLGQRLAPPPPHATGQLGAARFLELDLGQEAAEPGIGEGVQAFLGLAP